MKGQRGEKNRRLDSNSKRKLRIESRNVCEFAMDERMRMEIAGHVCISDLYIMGN